MTLEAPFPWYGGKSRAAPAIWEALGSVGHYVEPFAGSLAVLLGRPGGPGTIETVNDKDAMLANFWRALAQDADALARKVDWPINEADLHARHLHIAERLEVERDRIMEDPFYCNATLAAWWVWGLCQWIGSGWCDGRRPRRQLPKLASSNGVLRKGVGRTELVEWFHELATRLRHVRVACGDWTRVLSNSVLFCQQSGAAMTVGVVLDPPYLRGDIDYAAGGVGTKLPEDVRRWAIEHGEDRRLRIVLCGLDGDHDMPGDWRRVVWAAKNGTKGVRAETSECLWFSPHCHGSRQTTLF